MANYTVGDMVFDARTMRGYSQEELGFGICSTSTLSRIENNTQVPAKRLFDALMQRLGVSDSIYSAYIGKQEMELYRLMRKMISSVVRFDYEDMGKLIAKVEKKICSKDCLERQYVLFAKAILCRHNGGSLEDELALLVEAIRITMPDFNVKKPLNRKLLTFDEIEILNSIAINIYDSGKQWEGLRILWDLKDYMEEYIIDEEEKAKLYPMILYNITLRIGPDFGRHKDVIELCERGIDCCVKYGRLTALPYFVNNKACAVAESDSMDEAKELFHQAYYLFKVCRQEPLADMLKSEIKSRYNINL